MERDAFQFATVGDAAEGALGSERLPPKDAVAGGALAVAHVACEEERDGGGTKGHPGVVVASIPRHHGRRDEILSAGKLRA